VLFSSGSSGLALTDVKLKTFMSYLVCLITLTMRNSMLQCHVSLYQPESYLRYMVSLLAAALMCFHQR